MTTGSFCACGFSAVALNGVLVGEELAAAASIPPPVATTASTRPPTVNFANRGRTLRRIRLDAPLGGTDSSSGIKPISLPLYFSINGELYWDVTG